LNLNVRQLSILEMIQKKGFCSVEMLSETLYFSPSTIRRDLTKLEEENLLYRKHGGAINLNGINSEIPLSLRENENRAIKNAIGQKAASFVNNGDAIIMDSSTTVFHMVPHLLEKKNLTIITNGGQTALELGSAHKFVVICIGGLLRENSSSYVGTYAKVVLERIRAVKLFFSSRAIDLKHGITDISEEEADLRRMMLAQSQRSYYLAESRKVGNVAFSNICDVKDIDVFITDSNFEITPAWKEQCSSIVISPI